jgi:long-chain acyl-CoA synthetase
MNDGTWPNLVAMFFAQAERLGDKPFLWVKHDGVYRALTWHGVATRVSALARGLRNLGVGPGDRVMLVSENRPEWLIADVAIMATGAMTVPAYVTNTVDDHLHILEDSGAKAAIVSTRRLATRLLPAAHKAPALSVVVAMEMPDTGGQISAEILTWDDVLARGEAEPDDIAANAQNWRRDDDACIIYTSGTGGAPKGVMLHHGAILHNCAGATDALMELGLGDEVFLCFLPLSHSYEHTAGQFFPMAIGAQIYYAEGVETLGANMLEARPTVMTAVPRLYETMHGRILRGVQKAGGIKERLFMRALELGRRRYQDPASLGLVDRFVDKLLERLVRDKVRAQFGGRLKAMVSGGAPLNPDIGLFFTALGLRILQGYGQTESAPVISVNRPSNVRIETVGPPVKDVEVRIADDGEICVRGELVMQGYWRNAEATAEAIQDGWLHTGDIGDIDDDGCLRITDRKKDIIVNSGGDNLSPQRVEGMLTLEPEIGQAMVYGDQRPHLVGLLVPDEAWLKAWAGGNAKPAGLAAVADDSDLQKSLRPAVERVNARLSNIEKVRRFIIAREPFTTDNALLTPTMKIRRHRIREIYCDALEALYR